MPEGRSYSIGWIIDRWNRVLETDETNNTAYNSDYQLTVRDANPADVDLFDGGDKAWQVDPLVGRAAGQVGQQPGARRQGIVAPAGVLRAQRGRAPQVVPFGGVAPGSLQGMQLSGWRGL